VQAGTLAAVAVPVMQGVVVSAQPVAVADIQAKVHGLVRNGKQSVHSDDAWAYARSLTPEQASVRNHAGCKRCHNQKCCCPFPGGLCCMYVVPCKDGGGACGKDCLCMPCCVAGICLPLYSCLCCSCERSDNAWVTRDKHGVMTGAIFLIDHEEGTLACYSVKCCTTQLKDEPDCYWTAM
jgi:hypothetical protein